jgi:hypothetical protein
MQAQTEPIAKPTAGRGERWLSIHPEGSMAPITAAVQAGCATRAMHARPRVRRDGSKRLKDCFAWQVNT